MIYFFVALHLVLFIRVLMLEGSGITPLTTISIALIALILAKAILIVDLLPAINRFPEKPLIYNLLWKTAVYLVVATCIHYLERVFETWRKTGDLVGTNGRLLKAIIWPHFWGIEIVLFLLIGIYCLMSELVRVFGKETMLRIFFVQSPSRGLK